MKGSRRRLLLLSKVHQFLVGLVECLVLPQRPPFLSSSSQPALPEARLDVRPSHVHLDVQGDDPVVRGGSRQWLHELQRALAVQHILAEAALVLRPPIGEHQFAPAVLEPLAPHALVVLAIAVRASPACRWERGEK